MHNNRVSENSPASFGTLGRAALLWIAVCCLLGLALFVAVGGHIEAQTSTLYGLVTAPDGVTPVEGCNMELWAVGGSVPLAWDTTLIDGSFAFAITALPLGDYLLVANPPPRSEFGASAPLKITLRSNIDDVDAGTIRLTYPQVEGVVMQPDGRRYPYGDVNLRSPDGTISRWDTASVTKTFRFVDLPPGQYEVENVLPRDSGFWPVPPVAITITERYVYDVSQRQFITITLARTQVEGIVVGPDGTTRVAVDSVNLQSADGQISEWSATTADEPFRFGGLPAGTYNLQVFLPADSPFRAPPPQPLTLDDTTRSVTVRLSYPQVEGVVVEPDGRTRVAQWDVNLRSADGRVSLWDSGPITENFSFSGLAGGQYVLEARPVPPFWSSAPIPITVTADSIYRPDARQFVTVSLTYPQVEGVVMEPDRVTPAARWEVNLRSEDGKVSLWDTWRSGRSFQFGLVPAGEYVLYAVPEAQSPFWTSEPVTLTIVAGSAYSPTATQRVNPAFTYPQVVGVVLNPDGTRATEGSVNLRTDDWTFSQWDNVSADYPFRFGLLAARDYLLEVYLPSDSLLWSPQPAVVSVPPGSQYSLAATQFITIQLKQPNVIGTLVYDNRPVEGAGVTVYKTDGTLSRYASTGSTGRFAIGELEAGNYFIEITSPANAEYWLDLAAAVRFTLADESQMVDLGRIELMAYPVLRTDRLQGRGR